MVLKHPGAAQTPKTTDFQPNPKPPSAKPPSGNRRWLLASPNSKTHIARRVGLPGRSAHEWTCQAEELAGSSGPALAGVEHKTREAKKRRQNRCPIRTWRACLTGASWLGCPLVANLNLSFSFEVFSALPGRTWPRDLDNGSSPKNDAECTQNQTRRPILKPFGGHFLVQTKNLKCKMPARLQPRWRWKESQRACWREPFRDRRRYTTE